MIVYRHDKPKLSESKIVYKSGIDGFFVTQNYTGRDSTTVWKAGFDSSGNAVLNILSVIGIHWDWASGGTLSLGGKGNGNGVLKVFDENGKLIGQWDRSGIVAQSGKFSGDITGASGTFSGKLNSKTGNIAGWNITEEGFMKNQNLFSNLKLRIGYGVSGNALGFGAYTAVATYGASGFFNYNGKDWRTLAATKNANPDLKWESTGMLNVGIDYALFNGRTVK